MKYKRRRRVTNLASHLLLLGTFHTNLFFLRVWKFCICPLKVWILRRPCKSTCSSQMLFHMTSMKVMCKFFCGHLLEFLIQMQGHFFDVVNFSMVSIKVQFASRWIMRKCVLFLMGFLFLNSQRVRLITGQEFVWLTRIRTNTTCPNTALLFDLYPEVTELFVCSEKHILMW